MSHSWALSGDLARPLVLLACALAALGLLLLIVELVRAHRGRAPTIAIAVSGALALGGLLLAVLRPVAIVEKGSLVGPKVVVLADASRSIDLPGLGGTRRQAIDTALGELGKRAGEVRLSVLSFGEGPPVPVGSTLGPGVDGVAQGGTTVAPRDLFKVRPSPRSDLGAALEALSRAPPTSAPRRWWCSPTAASIDRARSAPARRSRPPSAPSPSRCTPSRSPPTSPATPASARCSPQARPSPTSPSPCASRSPATAASRAATSR